jgi:PAS domain S-box-containing protein
LTRVEFELLSALAEYPRRAFSREHLTQILTHSEWADDTHALDTSISRLRRKLGESGNQPRRVVTVHGYGYRYEPDTSPDLAAAMASSAQPSPLDASLSPAFAVVALDRTVLWASDSFTQLLGWQPTDLLGTILYQLMHPDDRPHAIAAREDLDSGLPSALLIHLRNATGEYRLIEALARPIIDTNGEIVCFLGEYRPATAAQVAELAPPTPIHLKQRELHDQGAPPSGGEGRT